MKLNTKDLLSLARFLYARIDDNDIIDFVRSESNSQQPYVLLKTPDGVCYSVPDQDVELTFDSKTFKLELIDLHRVHVTGRLPEDNPVSVHLELQKLLPLSAADIGECLSKAQAEPMQPVGEPSFAEQVERLYLHVLVMSQNSPEQGREVNVEGKLFNVWSSHARAHDALGIVESTSILFFDKDSGTSPAFAMHITPDNRVLRCTISPPTYLPKDITAVMVTRALIKAFKL